MSDPINAGPKPAPGRPRLSGTIKLKGKPPSQDPGEGRPPKKKLRAAFYFDGFNLYHALKDLNAPHLKWLNLAALADALVNKREEEVVKIVWCSAEYRKTQGHIDRHVAYRQALSSVGVTPILGHFVTDELECRAQCRRPYTKQTEKCGDVNVGIYLISDGFRDVYDHAYLVTADSDQVGTVDLFNQRLAPKKLTVVAPPRRVHSRHLISRPVGRKTIFESAVENCLFDEIVRFNDGSEACRRPAEYAPPDGWKPKERTS